MVNNVKIDMTNKTKFLGVVIDEYLSFEYHVKHIKGKVARGLGILYKSKRLLNKDSLVQLYNSFIYPYINYQGSQSNARQFIMPAVVSLPYTLSLSELIFRALIYFSNVVYFLHDITTLKRVMWPLNQIRNCDFKLVIMCQQTPYDDFLTRNPYFQT